MIFEKDKQQSVGTSEAEQFRKMTEQPVKSLIITMAIPTIISMLVTAIYNMGDTYFVSQLGKSASGAVGVVFSLMAIVQALGFMLGMGCGSIVSRSLGKRDLERANTAACSAFYIGLCIGAVLTVGGLIFIDPLVELLGATPSILPYARAYAFYILLDAPVMMGSFIMNNILRAEGKAAFSMIGLTTGGILNLFLDPLFIFRFDMGIEGAAIATLISQCVSFLLLLSAFLLKKSTLKLSPKLMAKKISVYSEICRTGMPSLCRQGLASISTVLLNRAAGAWGGDAALSGMTITAKVFMFIFCVGLGVGQGFQPVIGYNYGAGLYKRVKEAFRFTWIVNTIALSFFGVLSFLFADKIIPFFIQDVEVIKIGAAALRFQAVSMPFLSTNVICNMTFQSTGQKLKATLLSACRQGFFLLPLLLILPEAFGLVGVESAQAISDLLTFIISLPFAIAFDRKVTEIINRAARKKEKEAIRATGEDIR